MKQITNKIGLLGGTFNPVHNGHIEIAKIILNNLPFDKILLLPSGNPPHKTQNYLATFEQRLNLVKLAVNNLKNIEASAWDNLSSKKSYTDTLVKRLNKIYPNTKFYFIIGEDNAFLLPTWNNFEWLIENVDFVVVTRNFENKSKLEKLPYIHKLHFINIKPIDVSSTMIREKIIKGEPIDELVPAQNIELTLKIYKDLLLRNK